MRTTLFAVVLVVGVTSWGEAGSVFTYSFTTDTVEMRGPVSGSFEVDSRFIGMSGNTDISGIIANL
jgi:hypothetical protein